MSKTKLDQPIIMLDERKSRFIIDSDIQCLYKEEHAKVINFKIIIILLQLYLDAAHIFTIALT